MDKHEYIETRKEYVSLIRKELVGPGSEISIPDEEHELISTSPDRRYSVGILYTKCNNFKMDANDTLRPENEQDSYVDDVIKDDSKEIYENTEIIEPEVHFEEDNLDEEIGLATQNMPSSMGITFLVNDNLKKLFCDISFATYKHARAKDCRVPYNPKVVDFTIPVQLSNYIFYDKEEKSLRLVRGGITKKDVSNLAYDESLEFDDQGLFSAMYRLCDQLRGGYVREPHNVEVCIDFNEGEYIDDNKNIDGTNVKITALKREVQKGLYSYTVMMVNDCELDSNGANCVFQPKISVSSEKNSLTFKEYSNLLDYYRLDEEEQSLELQYRNKKVYGSGLGTSIDWEIDDNGNGVIFSENFPMLEIPSMNFDLPEKDCIDKNALSMKYLSDLSELSKDKKIEMISSIIKSYDNWIEEQEEKINDLDDKFIGIAKKNINGCRQASKRMKKGLDLLLTNSIAWNAFELANRAMFMQRVHLQLQKSMSKKDRYPYDEELSYMLDNLDYYCDNELTGNLYFWRPFQIAFLLMSIESIIDETCGDRKLVDLIWFPTGGGKTEAYLALTAFTIFYRRMNYKDLSNGTTVIMRYTLRLLAAQQFTRASTLICACEYIRQDSLSRKPKYKAYDLGSEEISIGLWIGHEHIPNTNAEAKKHLEKLNHATEYNLQYIKEEHNKFQVLKCPWCGTKLVKDRVEKGVNGSFGYRMKDRSHFEIYCPQESCYFNQRGALPIQIIDEELYSNPPTLLFGTVDKFAMLPWKNEIGNFFAIDSNNRPPELIIQDELHLISGPLGTMVGLYESIIEEICTFKNVSPKIVASTATIRRAKEQCAALYNRDINQFPHPGLDADDSFFARENSVDYEKNQYGRLYVGLMPSGKSKAMMEIRSISSLMQTINEMKLEDSVKDKYWTLTVYFNSLKDLGKCSTMVEDDVKEYIRRIAFRSGGSKSARKVGRADELTSRVSTTQLNETLDKLEKNEYSKEKDSSKKYASNILLATNMISVGIDVDRLNVMLLVSQPKLTSEYIQASSRVGRAFPGVAFTMYDSSNSRDRSHYEQFKAYHSSFYKSVEPTGATPFSKPARDRAMHAVVIALIRMLEPELRYEKDAGKFSKGIYSDDLQIIENFLIKRASEIRERLNPNMEDESEIIASEIESIFDRWEFIAKKYEQDKFCYGRRYLLSSPDENEGRLLKIYNTSRDDSAIETMTSMRNVDSTIRTNILVWEED